MLITTAFSSISGIGGGGEQDASLLHICSSSEKEWKMPTYLLGSEAAQSMQHSSKLLREYELRFCTWNACEIWSLFPSLRQSTDGDVCLFVDVCCPCSSDKKGWLLPISGICLPLPVSYPGVSIVPALKCGKIHCQSISKVRTVKLISTT